MLIEFKTFDIQKVGKRFFQVRFVIKSNVQIDRKKIRRNVDLKTKSAEIAQSRLPDELNSQDRLCPKCFIKLGKKGRAKDFKRGGARF